MNINYKIGDCREVLKDFEDDVFDACVTDPPYGLEFMGKEWDTLKTGRSEKYAKASTFSGTGSGSGRSQDKGDYSWFGSAAKRPVYFNRPAKRCKKCGKQAWSGSPCQCDTPEWELDNSALYTAQKWHYLWAKQVYRVLKPGGYLLAFGGTRTYHRMVCAVEDAGFEIRDTIAWVYGSGFPKSMDISKQIDKIAPRLGQFSQVGEYLMERRKANGLSDKEVAKHFPSKTGGTTGCVWNWENGMNVPTREQWETLTGILDLDDRFDALIERVEAEREVVGSKEGYKAHYGGSEPNDRHFDITTPATPDAKKWNGWGTALKPAVEPIVVARKPIAEKNVAMNVLTHGVGGLNIDATRIPAYDGVPEFIKRKDDAKICYGNGLHGSKRTGEINTQGRFPANIILECTCEKVIPGKVGDPKRTTLRSSPMLDPAKGWHDHSMTRDKQTAPDNYGDTAPIHTNPNCPCYVLDAQSGERPSGGSASRNARKVGLYDDGLTERIITPRNDSGGASRFFYVAKASRRERWFYCSVCKKAYSGDKREAHKKHSMHCLDCGVDYEPQYAPTREGVGGNIATYGNMNPRPFHYQDDHKSHNTKSSLLFHVTQKPEQLIRYLIRLVTPKGGTVLDPFLGSGTTLVAARMEGMSGLGVEIGTEYEPLIKGRLNALPRALEEFHQPTTTPSPNESKSHAQETE